MTSLAGVLGFPVAHSRSPEMHNAAFEALGLDWHYVRLPVSPELFEETVRGLPASGYGGANVTIPYKETALALANERSATAAAIGAANTLTFADGMIRADNTDAGGLIDALGESPVGKRAMVLGAGGAGRAAAFALRDAGAAEVAVWNRTPERARELADDLGVDVADTSEPFRYEMLVNTTPVGLYLEFGLAELGLVDVEPPEIVVDLAYSDAETPVVAWARTAGARVVDGIEVLVRQGARSFQIWTGLEPPLDTMRAAARR